MAVDVVLDGTTALDHLAVTCYDVVVLDRDLPGTHGDEVCRQLAAERSESRVLMLTAASTVRDRVDGLGLGLGADDYLPKPFDFAELVARIRALGRRPATSLPPVLECGDVTLDPSRRVAFRAGRRLELSPKEFALLECLLASAGRVVSAEQLLERVWDEAADPFTTAVKQTMRRLRAKLGELGETLDGLFGRLEASFQAQRHFVANASHELRTPLTAERTVLQVALADPDATAQTLRSACETALKWGDQQERLIESLLTLASSERGVEQWEPFDLADIGRNVILDRHQEAERRGIHVDAAFSTAPATGDPALAESLMASLVSNAIRHNLDGGWVEVATGRTDGRAIVTVSNTGPLIPPDEVDRLFQPFQRLGSQRARPASGHGLGLTIVRAIVSVHGATLTPRARPEGGLDITVSFP
jgi:DNA-binding response OmpR family regulator